MLIGELLVTLANIIPKERIDMENTLKFLDDDLIYI